jgi:hypothetical protein
MEMMRECSLQIKSKRKLVEAYNASTGEIKDPNTQSEVRRQVTRFGEDEKSGG